MLFVEPVQYEMCFITTAMIGTFNRSMAVRMNGSARGSNDSHCASASCKSRCSACRTSRSVSLSAAQSLQSGAHSSVACGN